MTSSFVRAIRARTMTYQFTVKDRFALSGIGVLLAPGVPRGSDSPNVGKGARIVLRKPDGTEVHTSIADISMVRFRPDVPVEKRCRPLSVAGEFSEEDVPVGTEVFLAEGERNRFREPIA